MFSVEWYERALNQLAGIYVNLDLDTQRRVASSLEALIRRLESEPLEVGESRAGQARIAFADILVIRFSVDKSARQVRVQEVKRYGR